MIYFWVPLCALHSGSLVSLVFFANANAVLDHVDPPEDVTRWRRHSRPQQFVLNSRGTAAGRLDVIFDVT